MKRLMVLFPLFAGLIAGAQKTDWKIAEGKIVTSWAEKVDPAHVLPEYPRPQMARGNWKNLNGLWEYSLQPEAGAKPAAHFGKILVPFAIESALSGVAKTVGKDSVLWYKTSFNLAPPIQGKRASRSVFLSKYKQA